MFLGGRRSDSTISREGGCESARGGKGRWELKEKEERTAEHIESNDHI